LIVVVERVAYGSKAVLLLSKAPVRAASVTGVIVPFVTVIHRVPLDVFEHPFWKFIFTPPGRVVPVMAKIAVNKRPVVPGAVRNPKGPIMAR
jgi:hypothetical protein